MLEMMINETLSKIIAVLNLTTRENSSGLMTMKARRTSVITETLIKVCIICTLMTPRLVLVFYVCELFSSTRPNESGQISSSLIAFNYKNLKFINEYDLNS